MHNEYKYNYIIRKQNLLKMCFWIQTTQIMKQVRSPVNQALCKRSII